MLCLLVCMLPASDILPNCLPVFGLYALLGLTVNKKADGADYLFPGADNDNDSLLLTVTMILFGFGGDSALQWVVSLTCSNCPCARAQFSEGSILHKCTILTFIIAKATETDGFEKRMFCIYQEFI